jgi:YidC/Oxa1 family membrane protein insertase
MSVLYGVPLDAAVHLITALASVVSPVIAIVLFTLAVRLLLMPLSYRAFRGQAAQAAIAPKLQALRERYGQQPQRLRTEMTTLYQQEGVSMYAGFGPLLLQWPFMSVMYLTARRVGGSVLGVPLSTPVAQRTRTGQRARRGVPRSVLRARGHWLPVDAADREYWLAALCHLDDSAGERGVRGVFAAGGRDLPGHHDRVDDRRAAGIQGRVAAAAAHGSPIDGPSIAPGRHRWVIDGGG